MDRPMGHTKRQEKKMKIPNGTRTIECKEINLTDKDIILVKEEEDFIWAASSEQTIFKLTDTYYIISPAVALIYKDEE